MTQGTLSLKTDIVDTVATHMTGKILRFAQAYNESQRNGHAHVHITRNAVLNEYVFTDFNDYAAICFSNFLEKMAPVNDKGWVKVVYMKSGDPFFVPDGTYLKKNDDGTLSFLTYDKTFDFNRDEWTSVAEQKWGNPVSGIIHLESWQGKIDPFTPAKEIRYTANEMKSVIRGILVGSYKLAE